MSKMGHYHPTVTVGKCLRGHFPPTYGGDKYLKRHPENVQSDISVLTLLSKRTLYSKKI